MFHTRRRREPELIPFPLPVRFAYSPALLRIPFFYLRIVGAPLSGRVSDLMIKKWRRKRAGKWVAEDRLRAALFGASWLPLSMVFFGLAHAYIGGTTGLAVVLGCLFIHGIGVSPGLRDRSLWPITNHQELLWGTDCGARYYLGRRRRLMLL